MDKLTKMRRIWHDQPQISRGLVKGFLLLGISLFLLSKPLLLQAMPTGARVTSGSATVQQNGSNMQIQQQTNQVIINWNLFSIEAWEKVQFLQPSINAVALNRIIGNQSSLIYGQLTSNGKIFLINQNGILFGPSAQVNVGCLVASTLNITDDDFLCGHYVFSGNSTAGTIINQGNIVTGDQGVVAFLGPTVVNEGNIIANQGSVLLMGGDQVTLDFSGDGRIQFSVAANDVVASVINSGYIEADGGFVVMSAAAKQDLTTAVVNQEGIIRAKTLGNQTGTVELGTTNGQITISGTIDVTGDNYSNGGNVYILGDEISLTDGAWINASGGTGGGNVLIGNVWPGSAWDQPALSLSMAPTATIQADAIIQGNGGDVILWSENNTNFAGTISTMGGKLYGNGGQVETSGYCLQVSGTVNTSAYNGTAGQWLLDPYNVTISDSGDTLTGGTYTPVANDSSINVASINSALNNGTSVTITTGTSGSQGGDITVAANIDKTAGSDATLTLQAAENIFVNPGISITSTSGKLNVNLLANEAGEWNGYISINGNSSNNINISTQGGSLVLEGSPYAVSQNTGIPGVLINYATIDTRLVTGSSASTNGGGNITIYGESTSTLPGDIAVSLQNVNLYSGGGTITINGKMNSNNNGTGVYISNSWLSAGSGLLTVTGQGATGIYFEGTGNTVTAGDNISLTADTMQFDGGIIQGDPTNPTGILMLSPFTPTTDVTIGGTNTGGLYLSGNLFSGSGVFQRFSTVVIGNTSDLGALLINDVTFDSNVDFVESATSSESITVAGNCNAGSQLVTFNPGSAGVNENGGYITAGSLELDGSNAIFTLTSAANAVGILAGNFNQVFFTDNSSVVIGQAGSTTGLTFSGTGSTITVTGDVTIQNNITATGASDIILTVTAADNVTATNGAQITTTGSGKLTVNFNADSDDSGTGAVVINGSGTLIATSGGKFTATGSANPGMPGVTISNGAEVRTNGGDITLTGNVSDPATQTGLCLADGATLNAGSGNITFIADTMSLLDTTQPIVIGSGILTLETETPGGSIGIGGGSGNLQIPAAAFSGTPVFQNGFFQIVIGRLDGTGTINIGSLTVNDPLLVESASAGGTITFTNTAVLITNNYSLTLTAANITFPGSGNSAVLSAGGNSLTLNAESIIWPGVTFPNQGGTLTIVPLSAGQSLQIGGMDNPSCLSVTAAAFTSIGNGNFNLITIGRMDGSGTVNLAGFSLDLNTTVESPGGTATIAPGAVIQLQNGLSNAVLNLQLASLTEDPSAGLTCDQLLLNGSGSFQLVSMNNNIGLLAANVGSLNLDSSGNLTVGQVATMNGINAGSFTLILAAGQLFTINQPILVSNSGEISLTTDQINGSSTVRTTGELDLAPATNTDPINVSTSTINGELNLTPGLFISNALFGGNYSNIILGGSGQTGTIAVTNTTFLSPLTITTTGDASFSGTVKIGTASPWKNLTINASAANIPSGTTIYAANVYLNLQTLSGISGDIQGTGQLYLTAPSLEAIYVSNSYVGPDFTITYTLLNSAFTGFSSLAITGSGDIYLDSGSINLPVNITSTGNNTVHLEGNVTIGNNSSVQMKENTFDLVSGYSLNIGGGNFTLAADSLIQEGGSGSSHIYGTGQLTVMPRDPGVTLNVNSTGTGTGLVVTDSQINGGLFGNGFSSFVLGNPAGTAAVTVAGVTLNNSVVIQSGSSGQIDIGTGGLTVAVNTPANTVTLKAGIISNGGGNLIDANNGTINLFTDTLNLSGTNVVTGAGTLGIATYDGTTPISLGNVSHGGLNLPDSLFTGDSAVFGNGFSQYSIGNSGQSATLYVDTSHLTKNVTLTTGSASIIFEGTLTVDPSYYLLITTSGAVTQTTAGIVTAPYLLLLGTSGTYDLSSVANNIGILAANASFVKIQDAVPLTIGSVTPTSGSTVSGILTTGLVNLQDTSTTPTALTVSQPIMAGNDEIITLTADTMSFNGAASIVAPGGTLIVQQNSTTGSLAIGTGASDTLQLGSALFAGSSPVFQHGFSTIYLGNGTGPVQVGGSVSFTDPVIIRGDTVELIANSSISTTNTSLQFIGSTSVTTDAETSIVTGNGALTFETDNLSLWGNNTTAPIQGTGTLTIEPWTTNNSITLGPDSGSGLVIPGGYFDSSTAKVFQAGFSQIIIGAANDNGVTTQSGSVSFSDNILLQQPLAGGAIDVNGVITTNGNSITVLTPSFATGNGALISAGNGTITLIANSMNLASGSQITGNGLLYLQPQTPSLAISLGTGSSGLCLPDSYFSGPSPVFSNGFSNITIGRSDGTGTLTAGTLTVSDNLTLLETGAAGNVQVTGTIDLQGNNLTVAANGSISATGQLNMVDTLTATSTTGNVTFNNTANTITNLETITAENTINIQDNSTLTIIGTISSQTTNQTITLETTDNNLTIGVNGTITSIGNTPVYLIANGGYFINENTRSSTSIISPGTSRWVVYSLDSTGDIEGTLDTGSTFRRYGTPAGDTADLTGIYAGNGFAHQDQPVIIIIGTRVYGDPNASFNPVLSGSSDTSRTSWQDINFITSIVNDLSSSANFDMRTIGDTTPVNQSGTSYGTGNSNPNYQVTYVGPNPLNYTVETQFWIDPRPITVTMNSVSRVYYDPNPAVGFTVNTGTSGSGRGLVNGDTIGSVTYSIGPNIYSNAGNYVGTITASGVNFQTGSANNYTIAYVAGNLTINPRPVTVTMDSTSRIYGDPNPAVGFTANTGTSGSGNGLVNGDTIGSVTYTIGPDIYANAGNYTGAIIASGVQFQTGSVNNYTIAYVAGNLTINPRPVTVTMDSTSRIYGDPNPAVGFTANTGTNGSGNGLVNGDTIGSVTYTIGPDIYANAGNYAGTITASGIEFQTGSANNYTVAYVAGNLTINPRPVTITMDSTSRVYGDPNPAVGFTANTGTNGSGNGLVNGDTIGSVTYTIGPDIYSNAGNYAGANIASGVQFQTGSANNYTIAYVAGNLTIDPRPVTVIIGSASRVYGDPNPAVGFTVNTGTNGSGNGLVNGDTIGSVTYTNIPVNANVGNYTLTLSTTNFTTGSANNYSINFLAGTLSITPAPLTIIANDKSRPQNTLNPPFTATYQGFKLNDDPSVLTSLKFSTPAYIFSPVGIYSITPSGVTNMNYQITYISGTLTVYMNQAGNAAESNANAIITAMSNQASTADNPLSNNLTPALDLNRGIPVLIMTGESATLDGFGSVNYSGLSAAFLPSLQSARIPTLTEIAPTASMTFSIANGTDTVSSFMVTYGNGIMTIRPLDEKAQVLIANRTKGVLSQVLDKGILSAVQQLWVIPDQIRVIYLFTELPPAPDQKSLLPSSGITLAKVTPDNGVEGKQITITIEGTGFEPGVKVVLSKDKVILAASHIQNISATQISCDFDLNKTSSGEYDLTVTNDDGKSGVLPNGFIIKQTASPAPRNNPSSLKGFNNGSILISLVGPEAVPGITVKLMNSTGITVPGIIVGNQNGKLEAFFNIKDQPVGHYDCYAVYPDGHSVKLENSIEVRTFTPELYHPQTLLPVYFDFDKSNIRQNQISSIEHDLTVLLNNPDTAIILGGYTDERGSYVYNLGLSMRRAIAAQQYLIEHGIKPERIAIYMYGKEFALHSNNENIWQSDRRVDVMMYQDQQ